MKTPWVREYRRLWAREQRFLRRYQTARPPLSGRVLDSAVPPGLRQTLEAAFARAFEAVFQKGQRVIRAAGREESRKRDYLVRAYAADLSEDRRALRRFPAAAERIGWGGVLLAGAEGAGLGLLGIGLPDIPVFTAVLLKSVYETAASFGFSEDSQTERLFTLRVITAALSDGDALERRNRELDGFIREGSWRPDDTVSMQLPLAAAALSDALLVQKFVQGIPLAGAVGGLSSAWCLRRVQRYAALKYWRRFLNRRRL